MNDISYKEDILSHPGLPQAQLGREDFDHQEGLSLYLNILTKIKDLYSSYQILSECFIDEKQVLDLEYYSRR